ncbi:MULTISPECIES: hypothetical protein [unclassified Modicisalibacter]|uniref:hypothetical protein n=1 Tax=unclassified Modicisalibacter TaxID=2679913 RepID=UPI001CCE222C|nr:MULTISPECIES: hypothetical protein [unclassified Modicisalibacter]MBZ9560035.1 hypothetical protein [Modicisalibacter sp. R2A 31.J]MBZ9575944.1 hypothetical protein [Modicisalibacter sp. MOD 31.J]
MLQCPNCTSYGVHPIRRRWWQRVLHRPRRYRCQDCGLDYRLEQLIRGPAVAINDAAARDDLAEPQ